jgi:hypothetical protein
MASRIYLAFRFHVNFYHSYRGDTPDEAGFGKDIRVIRHVLSTLDRLNAAGIPIRGTWDIENAFSLGDIMPRHCPDIIESLQRRVRDGLDEIEVMSYNNGLISAHTAAEFDAAISRALTNPEGSGLQDLFETVRPIVRPQEMMITPLHLALYPRHGITAISLFYSAIPFNTFSTFIPPLPFVQQYNPLTLTYPGVDGTMTLIPAHNHGDIGDHLTLRRWLKQLRRRQLALDEPTDLLLLIDADADDTFWTGFDWPIVRRLSTAQGLQGLVRSITDLDYVTFTTPFEYMESHPPLAPVSFGQDAADGSFDGMASWAEKWSNHRIWSGVERSRLLELHARRLAGDDLSPEIATHLRAAFEARVRTLSTTHFGLAAPVMNVHRLDVAANLVQTTMDETRAAFALAVRARIAPDSTGEEDTTFTLLDFARGVSTDAVTYAAKSSRALVRVPLQLESTDGVAPTLLRADGSSIPAALLTGASLEDTVQSAELCFVDALPAGGEQQYRLHLHGSMPPVQPRTPVLLRTPTDQPAGPLELCNDRLCLRFDAAAQPVGLTLDGIEFADGPLLRTAVTYRTHAFARPLHPVRNWSVVRAEVLGSGTLALVVTTGSLTLPGLPDAALTVRRDYLLAAGLPYLHITTRISYPRTPARSRELGIAQALGRPFDARWREVMPCEIRPAFAGLPHMPLRVWKHNYLDHVSHYDLDYGNFSRNAEIDAANNAITHGWLAISGSPPDALHPDSKTDRSRRGLLIAQSADAATVFAFCPLRTRSGKRSALHVRLNPFGTYTGRQLHYPIADTGLGRQAAIAGGETLRSLAPSYNGRSETFALMLAPYAGDAPPPALQADAEAFAYPYLLLSPSSRIGTPPHHSWTPPPAET